MKTLIVALFALFSSFYVSAGNYESVMKQSIIEMYQSHIETDLEALGGKFYRIGEAEQDKWLPYYYAAYSYISITFYTDDTDVIDRHLDSAQEMLNKAFSINTDESELYVLQGLLYSMRITGPARGMKYSALSNEALEKAKKLNPDNPRLWFCKAQNVYHTPLLYGGGAKKALPLYEKAAGLFDTFEMPGDLWPGWGKEINADQIAKIKE